MPSDSSLLSPHPLRLLMPITGNRWGLSGVAIHKYRTSFRSRPSTGLLFHDAFTLSVTDHKTQLWQLAQRTTALPFGRGAFTLGTLCTLLTEALAVPKLVLAGQLPAHKNATVNLDPNVINIQELNYWSEFHNAVAAVLGLSPLQIHLKILSLSWLGGKTWLHKMVTFYTILPVSWVDMLEINPIAETSDKQLVAANANLNFYDNAAFRQKYLLFGILMS